MRTVFTHRVWKRGFGNFLSKGDGVFYLFGGHGLVGFSHQNFTRRQAVSIVIGGKPGIDPRLYQFSCRTEPRHYEHPGIPSAWRLIASHAPKRAGRTSSVRAYPYRREKFRFA